MDPHEEKVIADVICVLKWSIENITHLGKHANLVDQVEEIFRAKNEAGTELLALKNKVAGLKEEKVKSMQRLQSNQTELERVNKHNLDLQQQIASLEKHLGEETRQRKMTEGKLSKLMMYMDRIKELLNEDSHNDIDNNIDHADNQPSIVNGNPDLEGQSTIDQVEPEHQDLNGQGEEIEIGPVLPANSPNTGSGGCSRVKQEEDLEGASKDTVMEDATLMTEAIEQEDTDLATTSYTNSPQFMDDNDDDDDADNEPGLSKRRRTGLRENLKKVDYADHYEITIHKPGPPYKCFCGREFKNRTTMADHLMDIIRSRST